MDYKYIEQLLERYWECQTSPAEESILHAFFTQEKVPAHLVQYKSLFEYQEISASQEPLGEEFDQKMLDLVGEKQKVTMSVKSVTMGRRATPFYRLRPFFRAAASVAIVVLVGSAAQGLFQDGGKKDVWDYNSATYKESFTQSEVDEALDFSIKELSTISESLKGEDLVIVDTLQNRGK